MLGTKEYVSRTFAIVVAFIKPKMRNVPNKTLIVLCNIRFLIEF